MLFERLPGTRTGRRRVPSVPKPCPTESERFPGSNPAIGASTDYRCTHLGTPRLRPEHRPRTHPADFRLGVLLNGRRCRFLARRRNRRRRAGTHFRRLPSRSLLAGFGCGQRRRFSTAGCRNRLRRFPRAAPADRGRSAVGRVNRERWGLCNGRGRVAPWCRRRRVTPRGLRGGHRRARRVVTDTRGRCGTYAALGIGPCCRRRRVLSCRRGRCPRFWFRFGRSRAGTGLQHTIISLVNSHPPQSDADRLVGHEHQERTAPPRDGGHEVVGVFKRHLGLSDQTPCVLRIGQRQRLAAKKAAQTARGGADRRRLRTLTA